MSETLPDALRSETSGKLNKFIFVFLYPRRGVETSHEVSWHEQRIAAFTQLDNNEDK